MKITYKDLNGKRYTTTTSKFNKNHRLKCKLYSLEYRRDAINEQFADIADQKTLDIINSKLAYRVHFNSLLMDRNRLNNKIYRLKRRLKRRKLVD